MGKSSFKFNAVRHCRETQNPRARREEMTRIVVGVEANQIAVKDTKEDLPPNREDSETG